MTGQFFLASGRLPTLNWRPQGDSNPRRRRERAVSWASRRWGLKAFKRLWWSQ